MDDELKYSIFTKLSITLGILSSFLVTFYSARTDCLGACTFNLFSTPEFYLFLFMIILSLTGLIFGIISIPHKKYLGIFGVALFVLFVILLTVTINQKYNFHYSYPEVDPIIASVSDPLTLAPADTISMTSGSKVSVKISIFNNLTYDVENVSPIVKCTLINMTSTSIKKTLRANNATGLVMVVSSKSSKGYYICNLCIDNGSGYCRNDLPGREIFVEIK